jgi:hypothetical protein
MVPDRGADLPGQRDEGLQQLVDGLLGQRGMLLQGRVQLRHAGRVVLSMVDLHGPGVDVGLERREINEVSETP